MLKEKLKQKDEILKCSIVDVINERTKNNDDIINWDENTRLINRWVTTYQIQYHLETKRGIHLDLPQIRYECDKLVKLGLLTKCNARKGQLSQYSVPKLEGFDDYGFNYFMFI